MSAKHISRAIFIVLMSGLGACVFEPAKRVFSGLCENDRGGGSDASSLVARFQDQRLQGMG